MMSCLISSPAKIDKIKLPNTKIKLLHQLLGKAIEEFAKVNKVQGIDFSNRMQSLVNKYNDRKEEDILISNVLEEFTDEIIDLYHELKKEMDSFVEMGMTEKQFHEKIEREYLVSPIICSKGLYVVAGKPKGGKSRILKHLAYLVQNKGLF